MCLDRVNERNVVIREDTIVYKIIGIVDGKEYSEFAYHRKGNYCFSKHKSISYKKKEVKSNDGKLYIPHFHCFASFENAKHWDFPRQYIRKYIIPKGTKVTIGKGANYYNIIVTPVLINPRIPE